MFINKEVVNERNPKYFSGGVWRLNVGRKKVSVYNILSYNQIQREKL